MPNDISSLAHTKWNCKYHIVSALAALEIVRGLAFANPHEPRRQRENYEQCACKRAFRRYKR